MVSKLYKRPTSIHITNSFEHPSILQIHLNNFECIYSQNDSKTAGNTSTVCHKDPCDGYCLLILSPIYNRCTSKGDAHVEIVIVLSDGSCIFFTMGWLRLVGSFKLYVSLENIVVFCRALLQKETYNFKGPTDRSHPIS